jgi:hypothetical protein
MSLNTKNKSGVLTNSNLYQLIKHSEKFLPNDPPCNCYAPMPRDATNFENGYHIKKSYSVLHYTKTETKQPWNVHFAHNYAWNHIRVLIYVGCSWSKHEHSPQLQHNFMFFRLFWQTNNLSFQIAHCLLQCLAPTASGNSASGSVYSRLQHARWTAVNGSGFANYKTYWLFYIW